MWCASFELGDGDGLPDAGEGLGQGPGGDQFVVQIFCTATNTTSESSSALASTGDMEEPARLLLEI